MKPYSIPTLVIASICFTIAVSDALARVQRKKRKIDLAFALICLSGTAFCLFCSGEYSVDEPSQSVAWLKGEVASSAIAEFAVLWYVAEETGVIGPIWVRLCLCWTVLASLSQALDLGALSWDPSRPVITRLELPFGLEFACQEVAPGPIIYVLNAVGLGILLLLVLAATRHWSSGHRRSAGVLLVALGLIIVAEVSDFLVSAGVYSSIYLTEYAWLGIILFVGLRRSDDSHEASLARRALRRTDQELKESQATLAAIIDSTADLIWSVSDGSHALLTFNAGFRDYLARRGVEPAAGMSGGELWSGEGEAAWLEDVYRRCEREGSVSTEFRAEGGGKVLSLKVNALRRGGAGFGLSAFARDVSEERGYEEKLRQALSEKEILVREIYHRTKNNMSVIIALLKLQAGEIGDRRLKDAFALSIDRILAMAMVHDRLYRTEDMARVDLGDYLSTLARTLVASYSPPEAGPGLEIEAQGILVMIDTAVDCGLILNELVTNALKYAFPADRRGVIRIGLGLVEDGSIVLSVTDDGVGMPPGFDPGRDGQLGMKIVRSLAGKLRAELGLRAGSGCSWVLKLREEGRG